MQHKLEPLTQLARDYCPACGKNGTWFVTRSQFGAVMFQCKQVDEETGDPCNTQFKPGAKFSTNMRRKFIENGEKILDLRKAKNTHVEPLKKPEPETKPEPVEEPAREPDGNTGGKPDTGGDLYDQYEREKR